MNKIFAIVSLVAGISVCGFACSLGGKPKLKPVKFEDTILVPEPTNSKPDAGISTNPEIINLPEIVLRVPKPKRTARKPVVQLETKSVFCRSLVLNNGRIGERVLACEHVTSSSNLPFVQGV